MDKKFLILLSALLLTASGAKAATTLTYRSSDHQVIVPGNSFGGAEIVSNTYDEANDVGTITFDRELTTIGNNAFERSTRLTAIVIPESVVTLGTYVFQWCNNLESVQYSTGLTTIPRNTFDCCYALSEITGLDNVTRIEDVAFGNCRAFTSFTIPANVEFIGQQAFGDMHNCESYTFAGNKVTTISNNAFHHNWKLQSFDVPSTVQTLGASVFWDCPELTHATIPGTITKLPANTFNKTGLTSWTIPSYITEIGDNAFNACTGLTEITIPATCRVVGSSAFAGCINIENVIIEEGVTNLKTDCFKNTKISTITIPSTVTQMGAAFCDCLSLTSATINSPLVGGYAFTRDTNLETVTFGSALTTIKYNAFYNCSKLGSITFADDCRLTTIEGEAFSGCINLTSLVIPNTVVSIGSSAFQHCEKLERVQYSTGMTYVPALAFDCCYLLAEITGLENVTRLENIAFGNCRAFTSFTIPANVEYIGSTVFGDMHNCESYIFAGNKVKTISANAFQHNKKLQSFDVPSTVQTLGNYVFWDCPLLTDVSIPNTITKLPAGTFKQTGLTAWAIPSFITEIGDNAFESCTSLTEMTIPSTCMVVGQDAFYNCTNLANVTIEEGVTTLKTDCFKNTKISTITIPTTVTEMGAAFCDCLSLTTATINSQVVGAYAFTRDTNLQTVTFGPALTTINNSAFHGCTKLGSVTFAADSHLTSIGSEAFRECKNLTSIYIPNTVTSMGTGIFTMCEKLESAHYSTGMTTVPANTFDCCYAMGEITGLDNVTRLEQAAFGNCHGFTSFTIPENVEFIGLYALGNLENCESYTFAGNNLTTIYNNAFQHNKKLKSIVLPESVETIGNSAFYDCPQLTNITIGESVNSIGTNAFQGCSALSEIISLNTEVPQVQSNTFTTVNTSTCILKVPSNSIDDYSSAAYWNAFSNIVGLGVTIDIVDGEVYARSTDYNGADIDYRRNFTNKQWQALYVPFELDVIEDLGAEYEVAEINGVHQFDTDYDGTFDETWLEFRTVKSGTLRANTPYVIRATNTGERVISLTNRTLYAAPATPGTVDCSTSRHLYTLTGTYSEIADVEGKYALSAGQFMLGTQGVNTIKPQRIYLTISERDGGYGTSTPMQSRPARVRVMIDGQMTSVEGISTDMPVATDAPAYNLLGVPVDADYKGIVIQNGKKIIKR